jgi:hypothetical protein
MYVISGYELRPYQSRYRLIQYSKEIRTYLKILQAKLKQYKMIQGLGFRLYHLLNSKL